MKDVHPEGLRHEFVAGLRFDTEVQYRVMGPRGARYCKLPWPPVGSVLSAEVCRDYCLWQCAAILSQATLLKSESGQWGAAFTTEVANADELGQMALKAIRDGSICIVHMESDRGTRWALVVGVEFQDDGIKAKPRALLLLDPRSSAPWACSHNARLELRPLAPMHAVPSVRGPVLRCRHLTGEARQVRVSEVIAVLRSTLRSAS